MERHDDVRAGQGRRPYEPPQIQSEAIFETTALACGKIMGQPSACARKAQNS